MAHLLRGLTSPVRRLSAVSLMCAAGWLLPAMLPASATAADPSDVAQLLAAGCPSYKAVRANTSYTPQQVTAARQGNFEIWGGLSARLVPPVNWKQDPYRRVSWRHDLHAFAWIDVLMYAFRYKGDIAALAQARDLALDWIQANPLGTPGLDEFAWYDKTAGDRVGYIGYIARTAACLGLLSPDQAARFLDGMRDHGDFLSDPPVYRFDNHGLSVDLGLALLAEYAYFLEPAPSWDSLARRRFESTLRARSSWSEGVWHEHSPRYQIVVTNLVSKFIRFTASADEELQSFLERMRESAGWMVMPDGALTQFGDTDFERPPDWALSRAAGDQGLRAMPESGLAIVKHRGSFVAFAANYFNNTHKHQDELSFELYERGHRVISDTGRYSYEKDKIRDFVLSNTAHNTLTVDGRPFARKPYGSALLATGSGKGWYAIRGRNPRLLDQGVRHTRLFLYRPGVALIIVDRVRSRRRHLYRRYLQLGPKISTRRRRGHISLRSDGLRGWVYDSGTGKFKQRAVRGRRDPLLGFTFPRDFVAVPRWTIVQGSRARNLTRVKTISFGRPRCAALLSHRKVRSLLLVSTRRSQKALEVIRKKGRLVVRKRPVPRNADASWPCRLDRG